MSTLGERLSFLRKQANMTQSALGEELNISAQAVSKWEKGLSEPDMETLIKICNLFNVSMDELSGKTEMNVATKEEEVVKETPVQENPKIIIGYCSKCKKPIEGKEKYHVETGDGWQEIYCDKCKKKKNVAEAENELYETKVSMIKGWVFGGLLGVLLLVLNLVFVDNFGIVTAILSCIGGVTFVSQMFWGDLVPDMMDFFCRSFSMPGVIFTLDIDGIVWAICVKIFLSILSVLLSIVCAIIGFVITLLASIIIFPFALRGVLKENKELKEKIAINKN